MSGVGKSATINSLLGDNVVGTNAFEPETRRVRVVSGNVKGVQMRFIDTPGLMPSASMTGKNQRILSQVRPLTAVRIRPPQCHRAAVCAMLFYLVRSFEYTQMQQVFDHVQIDIGIFVCSVLR